MRIIQRLAVTAFIIAGIGITNTAAQTDTLHLTLRDCIARALESNRQLQTMQLKEKSSHARVEEVSAGRYPQLKLSARAAKLSDVPEFSVTIPGPVSIPPISLFPSITENYGARVFIQQPLFTGLRISNSIEMTENDARAVSEQVNGEKQNVILNVQTAYWNVVRVVHAESTLSVSAAQLRRHVADANARRSQGFATDLEVLRAQTGLTDIEVRLSEARNNTHTVRMRFNLLLGLPLSTVVFVEDPIRGAFEIPEKPDMSVVPDTLLNGFSERRSDMRALRFQREAALALVSVMKSDYFPQVSLIAGADYSNPNQRILPPKEEWKGTWDISINVQWTLWDWNQTSSKVAQARNNVRQSELILSQQSETAELEIRQSLFKLDEAHQRITLAQAGLRQAERVRAMTHERYRVGMATGAEVLEAEAVFIQADFSLLNATIDSHLAYGALLKAAGYDLKTYILPE